MLKNFSKLLLIMLVVFVISSSSLICLAEEEHEHTNTVTTTETNEGTNTTDENTSTEPEIHSGDLYLFDNNIVMDKYVDGNVFIFGNSVEITGRVNGNLFVFANTVNFNECIIRYSIFACANSVYYNGGSGTSSDYGNLYVAASKFETTYNSYVTGDIKAIASYIKLKSAVYRDVDLICSIVNFGEGENVPLIYGNLNYTAFNEVSIPEGVLGNTESSVTYSKPYATASITDILFSFITCIVTTLVVYIILKKITPKFLEKVYNTKLSVISLLKAFGIGLASILIVSIAVILLLFTTVGAKLAFIIALLLFILYLIAVPTLSVSITNVLKPALKLEKNTMFYLVLVLVSIILYGITLIPFVGIILGFVINVTAIGLIINIFLPHKELTEEEQLALEEVKKQAKKNKEKRKQEKLQAKETKKKNKEN